jgi:hypothetical protein
MLEKMSFMFGQSRSIIFHCVKYDQNLKNLNRRMLIRYKQLLCAQMLSEEKLHVVSEVNSPPP